MEVVQTAGWGFRVLDKGDMDSLEEKSQEHINLEKAAEMQEKLLKSRFDFEDFLEQMSQLKKMGPLETIMGMIPGMGKAMKNVQVDERAMDRMVAIVQSMTIQERQNPQLLEGSRKKRIAIGSGNSVQAVNQLIKQFNAMQKMFSSMNKGKLKGMSKSMMPFFN